MGLGDSEAGGCRGSAQGMSFKTQTASATCSRGSHMPRSLHTQRGEHPVCWNAAEHVADPSAASSSAFVWKLLHPWARNSESRSQ